MKIKLILRLLFIICLSFLLIPSNNALANNNKLSNSHIPDFRITKDTNKIVINWDSLPNAHKYIIKKDNDTIYEGTETQFESLNLYEGDMNEYELAAIDNNNTVLFTSHLRIYTKLSSIEEIGIDTYSTSSSITLDWPDVEDVTEYNIYKDDELIGVTKESNFKDYNLPSNTEYQYKITGKVPFDSKKIEEIKEQLKLNLQEYSEQYSEQTELNTNEKLVNDELLVTYKELEENPFDLIEFSIPVKTLNDQKKKTALNEFKAKSQIAPLAALPKTWFKINTMILNTPKYPGYVPAPIGSYYYATDNRTTITAQGSTRSSLEAVINWSTLKFEERKSVGATKRYKKSSNGNYTFVDKKTASANNVYFGVTKKTKSMVDINFKHKAAHPYILVAPNVEYEFRTEIYKDGTTKIRGYHTLFPSLGIFRSNGSGYKTIYTHNQGSRSPWSLYSVKTIHVVK